jgi:hypothetical protein
MTKGEKTFYTETSDIFKKYGIQEPDHRADIAREVWNAALEFAAVTAEASLVEWEGTSFNLDYELREYRT